VEYLIELQHDIETEGLDAHALEQLALHALSLEHVERPAELSILLTSDSAVRDLNREYRKVDAPTDVLSFSLSEGEAFAVPDGEARHLGDVIISLDTARRQAGEHGAPLQDEVSHLLVHGVLHLLGHDHQEPEDAVVMRAHEEAILGGTVTSHGAHHDR